MMWVMLNTWGFFSFSQVKIFCHTLFPQEQSCLPICTLSAHMDSISYLFYSLMLFLYFLKFFTDVQNSETLLSRTIISYLCPMSFPFFFHYAYFFQLLIAFQLGWNLCPYEVPFHCRINTIICLHDFKVLVPLAGDIRVDRWISKMHFKGRKEQTVVCNCTEKFSHKPYLCFVLLLF